MKDGAPQGRRTRRLRHLAIAVSAFAVAPLAAQTAETYDLVIEGGRVIDPASGRDEIANVAVEDGRIAMVSTEMLRGERTLDARGQVVAPGFIDLHAHGHDLASQRLHLLDGVTTAMEMEIGRMPVATFYSGQRGRSLIHYGATASYLCARIEVLSDKRCGVDGDDGNATTLAPEALTAPATEEQEDRILAALERELEAGALGIGVGLEYAPAAGRREIYKLFKLAADHDVPVFVHVRMREESRASGMSIAVVNELVADAAATGAALQVVHVTSTALDDTATVIEILKGAAARGVDLSTEVYPYEAGSTSIGSQFFSEGWRERTGARYEDVLWTETGERLTEETFEKYRREKPQGSVVIFLIPDEAIDTAIADPFVSIASDGGVMDKPNVHPRGAGTFSRVLGHYVRERGLLDLPAAIAKMTIMPAQRLERSIPAMSAKGRLEQGADADIVVFDPETVTDNATYGDALLPSSGYRYVVVAGKVMVDNGNFVPGIFPGEGILRDGR